MTASQSLARQERATALTPSMVAEITGYSLAEVALIRHNMAGSLRCHPDDVPFIDVAMFAKASRGLGLDPLVKQSHWIARGGRAGMQIGIDGYRAIADRAGNYAGSSEPVFRGVIEWTHRGKKMLVPEYSQVTTWKVVQGHKCAFTGEARWIEYVPKVEGAGAESDMWAKMPHNQLAKCAEAQSLRKGWALQLSKAQFTSDDPPSEDELPIVAEPSRVIEHPQPSQAQQAAAYERFIGSNYPDDRTQSTYVQHAPQQAQQADAGSDGEVATPEPDASVGPQDAMSGTPESASQSAPSEALVRNRRLVVEAREAGVKGVGPFTANETWPEHKVEEANRELQKRLMVRNGDAEIARKQEGVL